MQKPISRRCFSQRLLHGAALLAGGRLLSRPARAIEPFKRPGPPRLLLSLAAYSFRDFLQHKDPAKRIDLFQFVDFCADHGCVGTEVTSYYFPANFTHDYLIRLRRHAFLRGVDISGTAVGNDFTKPKGAERDKEIALVKKWVDHAAVLGAPHIRVFAGSAKDVPPAEAKRLCIEALEECGDYAGQKGIFLGLENHGGIVAEADGLLEIVRAVTSPWVGVNLDTGNFHTADPYGDLARCAPYAVNVQVKTELAPRGQKSQPADLPRLIKILRDANYQGYVALEYEAAEDPWIAVPRALKELKALTT
ncbi:MAG: sugar phosphate isomerase/epimerase [Verrucomicrobia bacterium]|nr:sugar phosphate isomerase/epimerase [Verrucomicrobiota bacterium]